jgi:hypothetical protein
MSDSGSAALILLRALLFASGFVIGWLLWQNLQLKRTVEAEREKYYERILVYQGLNNDLQAEIVELYKEVEAVKRTRQIRLPVWIDRTGYYYRN